MPNQKDTGKFVDCLLNAIKIYTDESGFANLAKIGHQFRKENLNYKDYSPSGLKYLFTKYPPLFTIYTDRSAVPPIVRVKADPILYTSEGHQLLVGLLNERLDTTDERVLQSIEELKDQIELKHGYLTYESLNNSKPKKEKNGRGLSAFDNCWPSNDMDIDGIEEKIDFLSNYIVFDEFWDFQNTKENLILKKYLQNTFMRAAWEKKVVYHGNYAAFNTGLVTGKLEPIYVLLEVWGDGRFECEDFCVPNQGTVGNMLTCLFEDLPEKPSYPIDIPDFSKHLRFVLNFQKRKIVRKCFAALPDQYLEKFGISPISSKLPNGEASPSFWPEASSNETEENQVKIPKEIVRLCRDIENRICRTIDLVKYNAAYATPIFDIENGQPGYVVPLSLDDENYHKSDLFVVFEKKDSGDIPTKIITRATAYLWARIVREPLVPWLNPSKIMHDENADILSVES